MASAVRTRTTAARILDASRRLLNEGGAEAVTMRRVAEAVGITPMAVYRHFANRDALLGALADAGFAELTAQLEALPARGAFAHRLTALLDAFLNQALGHRRLFELMFMQPREGARRYPRDWRERNSPTANVWADLLADGMTAGEIPPGDVWEMVFTAGAMLQGLFLLYIGGRVDLTRAQFRSLCLHSVRKLYGISD